MEGRNHIQKIATSRTRSRSSSKKILPVVFLTDDEEAFPGLLYSGPSGSDFVQKSIHAKVFTKKLYHSFPVSTGDKIHVLYSGEDRDWIRFDVKIYSLNGNDIALLVHLKFKEEYKHLKNILA